jgi:hypothetical protein
MSEVVRDAIRYWERQRVFYNLAMAALACLVVARTWPHFQPALRWSSVPPLVVLALIANVLYCAAYVPDLAVTEPGARETWRRWRWVLFAAGTLLALFIELYWILDEIYPEVPFKGFGLAP